MRCTIATLTLIMLTAACVKESPPAGIADPIESALSSAPYAVGSSTFFIHDESRPFDSVAGINDGIRTLITEIWYPVDRNSFGAGASAADGPYRRATYGDYVFGDAYMHRLMMTNTTFFHMTPQTVREGVSAEQVEAAIDELFTRERHSYIDAPIARIDTPLPVVVMSHGDAGSRYNMETTCEVLAANGYLVIAAEHTGNSPYSMTGRDPALETDLEFRDKMSAVLPLLDEHGAYGSDDTYGQSYTPQSAGKDPIRFLFELDQSLLQRLNDLRAVVKELDSMNESGRFASHLALDRIGLMGRSFGGATVLVGLSMEDRFTAGFSVVPPGWADPRAQFPEDALVPDGRESVLLGARGPFHLSNLSKPTFLLSGAEDDLIIGLGQRVAESGAAALPTVENPHPLLRQAFESSPAPVVWGLLADSDHASFGISGNYWWPELKPDLKKRAISPHEEFKLVSSRVAHDIQQRKALAFFDLSIRQDASARERLLDQSDTKYGLILESRNF